MTMFMKIIVVLLLIAILTSLFSGLYFLMRGKQAGADPTLVAKALTMRISLSVGLFIILLISLSFNRS